MARVAAEQFGDAPCRRIYIAGSLREARTVEDVLTKAGVEYVVEVEKFGKKLLGVIPREYSGAAFYVLAAHAESSRCLLVGARLKSGIIEEEEAEDDDEGTPQ